jgi:hypothetical protein
MTEFECVLGRARLYLAGFAGSRWIEGISRRRGAEEYSEAGPREES